MSVKIRLKLIENQMSRRASYKRPLYVISDNEAIETVCWGKELMLEVPSGKHELTLKYKKRGVGSNTLFIEAQDEDTVNLICVFDIEVMTLFLVREENADSAIVELKRQAEKKGAAGCASTLILLIGLFYLFMTVLFFFVDSENAGNSAVLVYFIPAFVFIVLGLIKRGKSVTVLIIAMVIHTLCALAFVWGLISLQQTNTVSVSDMINAALHGGSIGGATALMSSASDKAFILKSSLVAIIIAYIFTVFFIIRGVGAIKTQKSKKE